MSLPELAEAQIAWVIRQVVTYIEEQQQAFRGRAVPLDQNQFVSMVPFFPASLLDSTRVLVLHTDRITNPWFYSELWKMGFEPGALPDFRGMAAITLVDTVVSHEPFSDRLLFHELVHAVQHQKLGLTEFAGKYVRGILTGGSYEAIPLERNAYELDGRFAAAPSKHFSVVAEVQSWMDRDRF